MKAASGETKVEIVKILGMTNAGKKTGAFMRDVLAPLVQPGIATYAKLKADIFP